MNEPDEKTETAAKHEAAHAVMRLIRGMPTTPLEIYECGGGLCYGTGLEVRPDDLIRVTLAGIAYELGYCIMISEDKIQDMIEAGVTYGDNPPDGRDFIYFGGDGGDIPEALRLLKERPYLGGFNIETMDFLKPEKALASLIKETGWELLTYSEAVEELGDSLLEKKRLTAEEVSLILAPYFEENETPPEATA